MGSLRKALNILRDSGCLQVKLFGVQTELATSFIEQYIYLKEQLADKLWLFRPGIRQRFP